MQGKPRIGEIAAYRAFEVRGSRLWSIGYGDYGWVPGVNEAFCDQVGKGGRAKARKAWVNDPLDPDNLIEKTIPSGNHGRIPSPNCECGFYAYKTEGGARARLDVGAVPGRSTRFGLGNFATDGAEFLAKVTLWGRVIEGTDGYRAQFARVRALILDDLDDIPAELVPILDYYEVPAIRASMTSATGYITKTSADGRVLIRVVRGTDPGWFSVAPGVQLPDGVPEVAVEYELRDGKRWITALNVITEVDE